MKFQDDVSNMNTYIRTYIRTSLNQYAPPLFQSWGHNQNSITHSSANPLVRYCHFGVSSINYSDSDVAIGVVYSCLKY